MAESTRRRARALILALAGLLAACAAGGPIEAPRRAPLGPTVAGADGTPLALSAWPAAHPRAIILALHGYGDYAPSTFSAAALAWTARGITTYAYDQRGFGRNPSHGYWPGPAALIDDAVAVSAQIRAAHPCLPLVVVGHSMGGGVVLAAAAEALRADSLVLAAPAIWGGAELNPLHRGLAWTAAAALPDRRLTGRGLVRIVASDNLEALEQMRRDPYYLSPPNPRELMGLVRLTDRAAAAAPDVSIPALMLLGERDQIVPEAAVRRVFDRLAGPHEVRRYAEGWHLLFRDLQAENVWRDVADWALSTPPPAGCPVVAHAGGGAPPGPHVP